MNKISFYLIIIIALSHYSCEDFFDSVTDVNIEDHESSLVVHGYFQSDNESQGLIIRNSKGYNEDGDIDYIDNASISLFENDNLLGAFESSGQGRYRITVPMSKTEGDEYRIEVSALDFESVSATAIVPPEVDVLGIEYKGESYSIEREDYRPEYEISIQDDANDVNYYAIEVLKTDTTQTFFSERVYITSNDLNLVEWPYLGYVFKDDFFNGDSYNISILLDYEYDLEENEAYVFSIKSISQEMYQFVNSYSNYVDNEGNPFAEPITLSSNIENGYGIFAFMNHQEYVITE